MAKKCRHCGEPFKPIFSSFEKYCQKEDCRIHDALEKVKKKKQAEEKKKAKQWQQQKIILRENTTNWKNALQTEINKIVLLIDKDLLCLATRKQGKMNAGHVFSRGSNATIRFNLHNIHRQSAQSNHFQSDDVLLREGMIREYGQHYMPFVSELQRTPKLMFKDFEYMALTREAQKIAMRLQKLGLSYSIQNRIMLRNKINLELAIYTPEFCCFNYIR